MEEGGGCKCKGHPGGCRGRSECVEGAGACVVNIESVDGIKVEYRD